MLSIMSAPLCSQIQTLKNSSQKFTRAESGGERPDSRGSLNQSSQGLSLAAFARRFPLCSPHCVPEEQKHWLFNDVLLLFIKGLGAD